MSKTIDQKVVEMQFDNRNFEQNVSTTMSTLDKLKQKLNLDGASKGLENVGTAAKNVDMSGLSNGVETVRMRFSALQVMGVTALANITNSAVNAGKKIVSALTIDPVRTGFQEYELKMDSVRTIMASTGESVETVNKYLEELNEYSDKTIYSFSDMTTNIGKFTNAGVKLEDAVMAIKGISNEAAVSGANANEASRAMYNFAQALSAGYVKLIDWKSIELANMATVEFKQQLLDAAVAAGTLTKASDGMYTTLKGNTLSATQNFNETLTDQWMTTEVLVATLKDYADETTEIGKKAFAAAQDVTKFTQMWDVLKETAQSGWARTWELIIGDIEQAKAILSPLTQFFSNIIDSMSDWRNAILESALTKNFKAIGEKVKGILKPVESVGDAINTVASALKDYDKLVDEIIRGDWGNAPTRWQDLAAAGYDWAYAQNLVNERLGCSVRHATDYSAAQDKLADSTSNAAKSQAELTEADAKRLEELIAMSDAELIALGYTEEQIKALRELEKIAEKLGLSISDFIKNIDEIDGRWLLVNSFKNAGQALITIGNAIKDAWKNIFPATIEDRAERLFDLIAALHRASAKFKSAMENNADEITRTFKGLFAVLDLVRIVVGGPLKIGFKILTEILKLFNLNILDVTAVVGDAIVGFRDWVKSVLDFTSIFERIGPAVKSGAEAIRSWVNENLDFTKVLETIKSVLSDVSESFRNWVNSLKDAEDLPKAIAEGIVNGFKKIPHYLGIIANSIRDVFSGAFGNISFELDPNSFAGKLVSGFKIAGQVIVELGKMLLEKINSVLTAHGFEEISLDAIAGLVNGLKEGAGNAFNAMIEFGKTLIEKIKDVLGIHSPSTVFMAIGGFIIAGLILGLQNGASSITEVFQNIISTCSEFIKNVDWGALLAAGFGAGILMIGKNLTEGIAGFGMAAFGLGQFLDDFGVGIKKYLKASALEKKSQALYTLAKAILVLVAAIAILTLLDTSKLWIAIGALGALVAMIIALSVVVDKVGSAVGTLKKIGLASVLLGIAASLLILAIAVKTLAKIDGDNMNSAIGALTTMIVGMIAVVTAMAVLVKYSGLSGNVAKLGKMLLLMSASLLLMVIVIKQISKLDDASIAKGLVVITMFELLFIALIASTKLFKKNSAQVGSMLLKMAAAILLLVIVIKMVAGMKGEDLTKGIAIISVLSGIFVALIAACSLFNGRGKNIGSTLLKMSAAIFLLALVVRMISGMDGSKLAKGIIAVSALSAIIVGLVAATKLAGGNSLKGIATTLFMMSISIGILAVVAALLGLVKTENLVKGITAVATLGIMMAAMIQATRGAESCKGNILAMTAAIAVMAIAIAALSFIDTSKIATATLAMATLMGMFALMTKAAGAAKGSIGSLIIMTVAIGIMAGILYLLSSLPIEASLNAVVSLSTLMLAMTTAVLILSKASASIKNALLGIVALTLMAVPLLAFVGILALMQNVQNATKNALALTVLATALTLLLIPLCAVGLLISGSGGLALLGIVALLAMAVPMVAFVGILALMEGIQNATANVEALIKLMGSLTAMLVVLAIVGPFALIGVAAMTHLIGLIGIIGVLAVSIGALMEKFPALESFLDKGIPILEKLSYAIGSLVGNLVSGFASGITSGLPEIATHLSEFMTNVQPFINGAKAIDPAMLEGVKALGEAILILTAANIVDGIASFITGGSSLDDFGEKLASLGSSLKMFADEIGGFTEEQLTAINNAATAIKTMAEAASAIPNEGGWAAAIFGDNSLSSFADGIKDFVSKLSEMEPFTEDQVKTVKNAASAIKVMAEAAETIPNEGGWAAAIFGDNSLSTFADGIRDFVSKLSDLGTFEADKVTTIKNSAKAVEVMAKAADEIDGQADWSKKLFGDNSLSLFADSIRDFVSKLSDMGTFNAKQLTTVKNAAKAVSAMTEVAKGIDGQSGWSKKIFGDNSLTAFAEDIKGFVSTLSDLDTTVMSDFSKALKELGESSIENFIDGFKGSKSKVEKIAKDTANAFISSVKSKYSDFKSAGKYLVEGFASGINLNKYVATSAAKAMAKAAAEAAKKELDINSPSKVFRKIGMSIPEGFAQGIDKLGSTVKVSAVAMGDTAISGAKNSITRLVDAINTDMDTQPTIRPVLDLSDVKSGTSAINSMLNMGSSIGVSANIGAISSMMSRRGQNGVNDDVVSAINNLGKSLDNARGDSYSIGNVSYDEGSAVAEAIKTIVRAATIERRS